MNIRPGWSNLTTANPTQSNHKKNNLQGNGSRMHYHNNCFNNDSDISFRHQTSPNNNNTKLSVGQNGRRWIGIDISPTACKLMIRRMESAFAKDVQRINLPKTIEDLKRLHHFEFQNWVMEQLFAHVNPTRTGDMGIDGYSIEGTPIQAKQSEDIGRNVVDNFETAIQRKGRKKGIIVAFSFGRGSYEEVARARQEQDLDITLRRVQDMLDET
jgi:hypothetical protein